MLVDKIYIFRYLNSHVLQWYKLLKSCICAQ